MMKVGEGRVVLSESEGRRQRQKDCAGIFRKAKSAESGLAVNMRPQAASRDKHVMCIEDEDGCEDIK